MATSLLPVGIVGASGYTGEELVRLLARHPRVRLASVCSRTLACTMDEETEATTGQQTAETPAASEATPPRDVARASKPKRRKRGRPKGSPNKPKPVAKL
jgi:N-acetyl-gamma-glutamylphosphate reductase